MKTISSLLFCFALTVSGQIPELGTLTINSTLVWEPDQSDVIYSILVQPYANGEQIPPKLTNVVDTILNEERWSGTQATALQGWHLLQVMAGRGENPPVFSDIVLIRFESGKPLPPNNFQIYSVITAAATNRLNTPYPPPLLPGRSSTPFSGKEWEPSK